MRIELASQDPNSGGLNHIDVREDIKGGDIFAVRKASKVPLGEDGRPAEMSFQGLEDDQLIALAYRVITGWSFQVPLPGSVAAAESVLSDLSGADLRKFRAGMKPLMDLVKTDEDLPDPKQQPTS
jgi:hypothetical protein